MRLRRENIIAYCFRGHLEKVYGVIETVSTLENFYLGMHQIKCRLFVTKTTLFTLFHREIKKQMQIIKQKVKTKKASMTMMAFGPTMYRVSLIERDTRFLCL